MLSGLVRTTSAKYAVGHPRTKNMTAELRCQFSYPIGAAAFGISLLGEPADGMRSANEKYVSVKCRAETFELNKSVNIDLLDSARLGYYTTY